MSSCPVPYFSNLAATEVSLLHQQQKLDRRLPNPLSASNQGKLSAKNVFRPYLGLPYRRNFSCYTASTVPCNNSTATVENTKSRKDLSHIFTPPVVTTTTNTVGANKDSILSQAETPRIVAKQLAEINQSNFFNLAAANSVQNLAKVAQKRAKNLNPLNQALSNSSSSSSSSGSKRKKDIFDDYY